MFFDLLIVLASAFLALFLRFDGDIPSNYIKNTIMTIPALLIIRFITFYCMKLYNIIWKYASVKEFLTIVIAVLISSAIFYLYFILTKNSYALPRSVHVISTLLIILGLCTSRLIIRLYSSYKPEKNIKVKTSKVKNILIIGAGDAGAIVAREVLKNEKSAQRIVGFIDDNKSKIGLSMFGSKVLGSQDQVLIIVEKYDVDEIIIAMPSVSKQKVKKILDICQQTKCKIKITPSIYELIDGNFTVNQIRDVDVEDLLGRDKIELDQGKIQTYIKDKVILVSGAGGSIGSEICIQTAKFCPKSIILLGKGENSIYEIHYKLTKKFPHIDIVPIIADVRDRTRMENIFQKFMPNVVFHAAAHKHVPLMEAQPEEAVRNNILGTKAIAEIAINYNVDRFIMISTDKAVNPTSVMGATKRVAEMIITNIRKNSKTVFATVRFGNVLGSRGSVIPLFKKQISEGGPVTITHPEMRRYFMTIPEASQLVLQAGAMASGGEVFVLDMGEPVKIIDLARELIKMSGHIPDQDIEIVFTGLRPGEKMFEELLTAEEGSSATSHEKIFTANMSQSNLDIEDITEKFLQANNTTSIIHLLAKVIPTYNPNQDR